MVPDPSEQQGRKEQRVALRGLACPEIGNPEAAPNRFQTLPVYPNTRLIGGLGSLGPPVGRASRLKIAFRDSL